MERRITTYIPYGINENLANAYNQCILAADTEWVLLLDHDVFISLNPKWYEMCLKAIENVDDSVGMITCLEYGRNGFDIEGPNSDCLEVHIEYAREVYKKYGNTLVEADDSKMAGFFMLVRKSLNKKYPFLSMGKGVNKIDHNFCKRIMEDDYKIMIMKGLYVYHRRGVRKLKWD